MADTTDVFDVICEEVRTKLAASPLSFDTVGEGWFWDKRYNLNVRIALAGPYRRDHFRGTNATDDDNLVLRLQLWVRGRTVEELAPRLTKMMQLIKLNLHHSTSLLSAINTAITASHSVNVVDCTVDFPSPWPEEEEAEDQDGGQFVNKAEAHLIFWVEEELAAL